MKRSATILTLLTCATLLAGPAFAADKTAPGQVDFGTFSPPSGGGEFVEVNVPGNLISLAAKLVEKQEPEAAKLLSSIKQVRVNVIGMDDANREDLQKRAQKVRSELSGQGWERLVTAQKQGQDVSVYLKMDKESTIEGITVVVLDGGNQAVFANVVGAVKPDQLATLAEKLNIEPLKKLGVPAAEQK